MAVLIVANLATAVSLKTQIKKLKQTFLTKTHLLNLRRKKALINQLTLLKLMLQLVSFPVYLKNHRMLRNPHHGLPLHASKILNPRNSKKLAAVSKKLSC